MPISIPNVVDPRTTGGSGGGGNTKPTGGSGLADPVSKAHKRSEPVFNVLVKHSPTKSGTAGSSGNSSGGAGANPAVASAALQLKRAQEEAKIYGDAYEKAKAAGAPPEEIADLNLKQEQASVRLENAKAALAEARTGGAPIHGGGIGRLLDGVVAAGKAAAGGTGGGGGTGVKGAPPPVKVDNDLEDISLLVTSFEYQDEEKKTDLLKITVDNHDLRMLDHPIVEKGTQLVVQWGYPGALTPERLCIVQKVTGFALLTIEAQDKGVLAQKETKSRTFENVTRSDVARVVAAGLGYDADQMTIEPTTEVHAVVTQAAQTDGQFLQKLADLEGFQYFVDFDGLHWHPRRTGQKPIRKMTYYVDPGVGDILTIAIENTPVGKPGAVTQVGRDPLAKTDIKATANADNTTRDTTGAKQDLPALPPAVTYTQKVDPSTGQITTTALKPPVTTPDGVSSASTSPTAAKTATDAAKQAAGSFTSKQQGAVKLSVEIVGDPFIGAKTIVEIDGIGKRMSGRYYLTSVTHKIDGSGYKTSFKCQSDGTGGAGGKGQGKGGKPNTKDPPPDPKNDPSGAPTALTPVQKVDPKTGETKTEYRNAQGKVPGDPPAQK